MVQVSCLTWYSLYFAIAFAMSLPFFQRFHPCLPAHLGKVAQLPGIRSEEHASQGLLLNE